jgi:hypothetical protein
VTQLELSEHRILEDVAAKQIDSATRIFDEIPWFVGTDVGTRIRNWWPEVEFLERLEDGGHVVALDFYKAALDTLLIIQV